MHRHMPSQVVMRIEHLPAVPARKGFVAGRRPGTGQLGLRSRRELQSLHHCGEGLVRGCSVLAEGRWGWGHEPCDGELQLGHLGLPRGAQRLKGLHSGPAEKSKP